MNCELCCFKETVLLTGEWCGGRGALLDYGLSDEAISRNLNVEDHGKAGFRHRAVQYHLGFHFMADTCK